MDKWMKDEMKTGKRWRMNKMDPTSSSKVDGYVQSLNMPGSCFFEFGFSHSGFLGSEIHNKPSFNL